VVITSYPEAPRNQCQNFDYGHPGRTDGRSGEPDPGYRRTPYPDLGSEVEGSSHYIDGDPFGRPVRQPTNQYTRDFEAVYSADGPAPTISVTSR
jgi:hypothetical protein